MSFAPLATTVLGQVLGVNLVASPVGCEIPSFEDQVSNMPWGYRRRVGNISGHIAEFYEADLDMDNARVDLDTLPRAYIEQEYRQIVNGHSLDPNSFFPDYYYGYVKTSSKLPSALRLIGLIPPHPEDLIGTVVNIPGYGHGFERDQHRIRLLLDAGFAVFIPERVEHGLSSPVDPRMESHRNADLLVHHLRDQIKTISEIHERDPRIREKPLYAIASSLGAAELIGAIHAEGFNFGFERIVLDSPLLSFGSNYPWRKRAGLTLIRTILESSPDIAAGLKTFYPRKSGPGRYPGMSDADDELNERYYRAFGPNHHALPYLYLDNMLDENASGLVRHNTRSLLPPTMITAAREDPHVNVRRNVDLFSRHMHPEDAVRVTRTHDAFADRRDTDLIGDVVRFFQASALESERIHQGPKGIDEARRSLSAA